MANLKLREPIIDAVIAKLKAGYSGHVTTINYADTVGITIAAPADVDYYYGRARDIPRVPAIVVSGMPGSDFTEEGAHSFLFATLIAVIAIDEDQDVSRLARKLDRHERAILETLWDDAPQEALTGSAYRLFPQEDTLSPVHEPRDGGSAPYRSWVGVVFSATQTEG